MNLHQLQIVSFNNPFPANYGGVIDVFYKIKYLSQLGYDLFLHIFYDDRDDIDALKPFCKEIYIYKRDKSFLKLFDKLPYGVASRTSQLIYDNLNKSDAPILFEGLQTTHVLLNREFKNKILIRVHNVEHDYMYGLSNSEINPIKKWLYQIEGDKYKSYENIFDKADAILTLSKKEFNVFSKSYPSKTYYQPVFHGNEIINPSQGSGKYALYHGDLSTADNKAAAKYVASLFSKLPYPLIIASNHFPKSLKKQISKYDNISFVHLKQHHQIDGLIEHAHVNVLYSNQATGTKLKVFYSLYRGRFCIVNDNIVDDARIIACCEVANTTEEYLQKINDVFKKDFKLLSNRVEVLNQFHPQQMAINLHQIIGEVNVESSIN